MKKVAIFVAVIVIILLFSPAVFGAEANDALSAVPDELKDYLPDISDDATPSEIASSFDAGWLLKTVLNILSDVAPGAFSSVATVLGILIVSAVLSTVRESISSLAMKNIISYVCGLCICGATYGLIGSLMELVSQFTVRTGEFLRYVLPTLGVLMASEGSFTMSVVGCAVVYGAVTLLESITEGFVFPMIKICFCISVGAVALGNDSLSGISQTLKKTVTSVISLVMIGFSCVLTFQSIVAKSADSVLFKGVKFALANIIPVVGSAVGDAVTTVKGSISVIKAAVGTVGAIAVLLIFLYPFCTLWANKVAFELLSSVAGILGLSREGKFLSEVSSVTGLMMATISSSAVFFIIAMAIFASAGAG